MRKSTPEEVARSRQFVVWARGEAKGASLESSRDLGSEPHQDDVIVAVRTAIELAHVYSEMGHGVARGAKLAGAELLLFLLKEHRTQ